jgi:hypothetical protein
MPQLRIAILGNCQAAALTKLFRFFLPDAGVTRFLFSDLSTLFTARDDLFSEFGRFEAIFIQPFGTGLYPGVDGLILKERFRDSLHFFPVMEFNAFHPDCVYILNRGRNQFLGSPIGDYHSALAFLGYSLGFTAEQTLSLFAPEVFERLGYSRFWKVSEETLFNQCRSIGFSIEHMYRGWVRRGSFMHSVNHPKFFVMVDIALALLRDAGLPAIPGNAEDYFPDEGLYDAVWPIYPAIAGMMGLEGSYHFKGGSRSEDVRFLNLREFVEESHEFYRRESPADLDCQRVRQWSKDLSLIEHVRSYILPRGSALEPQDVVS